MKYYIAKVKVISTDDKGRQKEYRTVFGSPSISNRCKKLKFTKNLKMIL